MNKTDMHKVKGWSTELTVKVGRLSYIVEILAENGGKDERAH